MLEIYKGVPIPPVNHNPMKNQELPRRVYPFENMDVGDMIFHVGKTTATVAPHVHNVAKKLGWQFTVRQTFACMTPKGVEVCSPANGFSGVGVWRVA